MSSKAASENSRRPGEGPFGYLTTVTLGMGEGPMNPLENMTAKIKD